MEKLKWHLGTVSWFDKTSGEGMIRSESGRLHYVHYSVIDSDKKWKALKESKKVKFQLIEDDSYCQVLKVKEI